MEALFLPSLFYDYWHLFRLQWALICTQFNQLHLHLTLHHLIFRNSLCLFIFWLLKSLGDLCVFLRIRPCTQLAYFEKYKRVIIIIIILFLITQGGNLSLYSILLSITYDKVHIICINSLLELAFLVSKYLEAVWAQS